MLTKSERDLLRAKVRVVEEAIEDVRACLAPDNEISFAETRLRSTVARGAVAELLRFIEEVA